MNCITNNISLYFYIISLMLCSAPLSTGIKRKQWVSSWDLSNKMNWVGGALPCPGRPAVFGNKPDYPVFADKNIAAESFTFSQDMELIFGEEVSLTLAPVKDSSCVGKAESESVFINTATGYWWDPDSWKCDKSRIWECNSAVPDIHRVPCNWDYVQFPNHETSLYRIIFTPPTPTVFALSIGDKNITTSEVSAFASSEDGQGRIFKGSRTDASIYVYVEEPPPCNDYTGCLCHQTAVEEEVCRIMSKKCPPFFCVKPIKMKGFCCDLCGADVTISHNGSLQLSVIQGLLQTISNSAEGKDVDLHAAKMDGSFYHVYFTTKKEETGDYVSASKKFMELFHRDYNNKQIHKVSANIAQGDLVALRMQQKKSKSTTITALLTVFIVCIALAAAFFVYRNRRKYEAHFTFRKFSLHGRRESTLINTPMPSYSQERGLRFFQNPTFETAETSSTLSSIPEVPVAAAESKEVPTQRENPLYAAEEKKAAVSFSTLRDVDEGAKTAKTPYSEEKNIVESLISIQGSTLEEIPPVEEQENEEDLLGELAKSRAEASKTSDQSRELTDVEQCEMFGLE